MDTLKIALAQKNFVVGDITRNTRMIRHVYAEAKAHGADLVVFPELCVTGYPPEDLVLRKRFQQAAMQAVAELAEKTAGGGPDMLIGGLWADGVNLYNAAFLLDGGKIEHTIFKNALPNYGVFDEKRVFTPGQGQEVVRWRGTKLGIMICEDMWMGDVPRELAAQGAELLISLNASPYEMGKAANRREHAGMAAAGTGLPLIYVNMVGGQDELVFDGRSFVLDKNGKLQARVTPFAESVVMTEWKKASGGWECVNGEISAPLGTSDTVYAAMVLGLRDYVDKNGFKGVVLGLSGGIDSGLTAAVAVDALGADRVRAVMLPSRYTSKESIEDATECAQLLGIHLDTVSIAPGVDTFEQTLKPLFGNLPADTTEENIQSRLRGNLLMAISNKLGLMVLTTGNKSEMSVGYATLYGDMCGGFSVLKDVYKTHVYVLTEWRNAHVPAGGKGPSGRVIPERMITKPPSAELKPNQTDQDTLPPYDVLDAILLRLIEYQQGVDEIAEAGYDRALVEKVSRMLYAAEYKRRQSTPGVKITGMSFGRDRRYPITNGFRG